MIICLEHFFVKTISDYPKINIENSYVQTTLPDKNIYVTSDIKIDNRNVSRNLYIYHQNVCSLTTKKNELDMYIESLTNLKPQFIGITEHFLNSKKIELFDLTNYKIVSHNSRVTKKRGGSLILATNTCNVEDLLVCKKLYKMEYFEVCGIKDLETGINLVCVYRNTLDKYFKAFLTQLELLLQHFFDKKCIIGGDFNVDLLTDDDQRAEFLSLLKCYNFRPLISSVTYIQGNRQSCLDNFLTNLPEDCILNTAIDHNGISDGHAALLCNVVLPTTSETKKKNVTCKREQRVFNEENNNVFRKNILAHNWNEYGINTFLKYINEIFEKSFKKKVKMFRSRSTQNLNWITKGIKVSCKMKRFLMPAQGLVNDETILNYRHKYIRIFRKVLRYAKKLAVQSEIKKSKGSSKAIWSVVNKHRKKVSNTDKEKILLKENNKFIDSTDTIVDIFADKFDHSRSSITGNLELSMNLLTQNSQQCRVDMSWDYITPAEITKIVSKMEDKRSSGWDEIPISVFKQNLDLLAKPLATFYNKCYKQGIFPEQLKIAKVLPVHKKGSKNDSGNYRPISLLPTLAKIFEKLIKIRLINHLNANNILDSRQFGYQANIGTSEAIDTLVQEVIQRLNGKMKVAGLFLDLSSAFDTVDHEILLNKLEFYGIKHKVLELLKSYLTNRYQYVELKCTENNFVKTSKSKLTKIIRGVPQGSILGPLFFLLFTNDLIPFMYNVIPNIGLVVFADDTNAVIGAKTIEELNKTVNRTLVAFSEWFNANNLKLNLQKTTAILFKTTAGNKDVLEVKLNNERVDLAESVKFLGIHIDACLNWKEELKHIESKISSACYALRSLREDLTLEQLKMTYYALVEAHLRYSIQFWGKSYDYNLKKAFILQKRAIRTMLCKHQTESCRRHFVDLKILTVPCLYIFILLTNLVKHLDKYETEGERIERLNSRRKDIPNFLIPHLKITEQSVQFQAVKLFNRLPRDFKLITNVNVFKARLRAYLLDKCFYAVDELT